MIQIETFELGPFQTNCYLIYCDQTKLAAIIDPATEAAVLTDYLTKNSLTLQSVLLTHGHLDHIGGVAGLKAKYNPKVYLHEADLPIVRSAPEWGRSFGLPDLKSFQPDEFITEPATIEVGDLRLKVLHTPGHTPGGLCYLSGNHAFVGDTLFERSIGRTDLPGGDFEHIITSIQEKLFTLDDNTQVFPGHGPTTTIGIEKTSNPFVNQKNEY